MLEVLDRFFYVLLLGYLNMATGFTTDPVRRKSQKVTPKVEDESRKFQKKVLQENRDHIKRNNQEILPRFMTTEKEATPNIEFSAKSKASAGETEPVEIDIEKSFVAGGTEIEAKIKLSKNGADAGKCLGLDYDVNQEKLSHYQIKKSVDKFRSLFLSLGNWTSHIVKILLNSARKIYYTTPLYYTMMNENISNKQPKSCRETHAGCERGHTQKTEDLEGKAYVISEEGPVKIAQPPDKNKRNGRGRERNYKKDLKDVESDGRANDDAGDPPGQESIYIPPGDIRKEAFRLSTFENYPTSSAVNIVSLAKNGFVFTGFYDRVKCFSCGRTVQAWEVGDDPADKKWHKRDCAYTQGQPTDNVPINGVLTSFLKNSRSSRDAGTSQQSQNSNGPRIGITDNLSDRQGGSFHVSPGDMLVIGGGITSPTVVRGNIQAPNTPRQWRMANVISADHRRFLTNLYLNRELDRLASFARWPTGRPNVSPAALAKAGFFYLGDMDRTQCFSCGGVLRNWSVEDDAQEEHRTHFRECAFVRGTERRNVPVPAERETQQDLARIYPCRYPSNPHMRSEVARIETFDSRWPRGRTRASPAEIAEAGFFFLGERDRVKCWYCNGGLQNWEYDDVPWIEHAKWFPNCQFLLQKQGQTFVNRHLALNAHLARPIIGRQDGATVDPSSPTGQAPRAPDIPPSAPRTRAPSPPPEIIDPQEEMRKRKERVGKEVQSNDNVKTVIVMGYSEEIVRKVLEDRLESGNPADDDNIFDGVSPLLEAVMEREKEQKQSQAVANTIPSISSSYSMATASSMEAGPSTGRDMFATSGVFQVSGFDSDEEEDLYSGSTAAGATGFDVTVQTNLKETRSNLLLDVPNDGESIKEIIEQKKEERACKICFTETADMVFVPCSHMICCRNCTESIRHCPLCRKKIEKAIRTYFK